MAHGVGVVVGTGRKKKVSFFNCCSYVLEKLKYTPAVRSNILSKLIFASCV